MHAPCVPLPLLPLTPSLPAISQGPGTPPGSFSFASGQAQLFGQLLLHGPQRFLVGAAGPVVTLADSAGHYLSGLLGGACSLVLLFLAVQILAGGGGSSDGSSAAPLLPPVIPVTSAPCQPPHLPLAGMNAVDTRDCGGGYVGPRWVKFLSSQTSSSSGAQGRMGDRARRSDKGPPFCTLDLSRATLRAE